MIEEPSPRSEDAGPRSEDAGSRSEDAGSRSDGAAPRTDEERDELESLIARALWLRDERGETFDLDEVCAARPEWRETIAAALMDVHVLQRASAGPPPADPRLGRLLQDRYMLDERIGSGAMGIVYGAVDLELGRRVAVKVLNLGLVDESRARERFDREAVVLGGLRHDSIVVVYDRGTDEAGAPFFVMERIEGTPLSDVLDDVPRTSETEVDDSRAAEWLHSELGIDAFDGESWLRTSARWAAEIAEGLSVVHEAGIAHRDVKPSNVIIRPNGRPVLLDFGIAAAADDEPLTRTGATLGTPAYMPPETLAGGRRDGQSADVYGLAATLYHLVTLHAPYRGSASEILTALAHRDPAPARRVATGVPADLQAILEVGMARDVKRRYPTIEAFRSDLESFLAHAPVRARAATKIERVWRRAKRSRAIQGAAALALVLLVIASIGAATRWSEARSAAAFWAAWPHVPANLGIVRPEYRRIRVESAREAARETIDRLVASGHDPVTALAIRAAFRFDHGDLGGAADDAGRLATKHRSALTRELARRYAAVAAGDSETLGVREEGLPEPSSPEDRYLLGFHALRVDDLETSLETLQGEGTYDGRHAVELGLVLDIVAIQRSFGRGDADGVARLAKALVAEVTSLETISQVRSATTAHLLSFAYGRYGQYEEAIEAGLAGVALSEGSHVTLRNLANCSRRVSQVDAAAEFVERALQLAPDYLPLLIEQMRIDSVAGNFELARERLEALPPASSQREADRYLEAAVRIETEEALVSLVEDDADSAIRCAETALYLIDDSVDAGETLSGNLLLFRRIAEAIALEEPAGVATALADMRPDSAFETARLWLLVSLLSNDFTADESVAVRGLLQSMYDQLLRERVAPASDAADPATAK
ncbi:MAG: protein kinase [Planctomycetota bacterium]